MSLEKIQKKIERERATTAKILIHNREKKVNTFFLFSLGESQIHLLSHLESKATIGTPRKKKYNQMIDIKKYRRE